MHACHCWDYGCSSRKFSVFARSSFNAFKSTFQNMFIIHFRYQPLGKRPNLTAHALAVSFVDVSCIFTGVSMTYTLSWPVNQCEKTTSLYAHSAGLWVREMLSLLGSNLAKMSSSTVLFDGLVVSRIWNFEFSSLFLQFCC